MQPLSSVSDRSIATDTLATTRYVTAGGVVVDRTTTPLSPSEARAALSAIASALDTQPGVLLGSSFEYPGRYSRYDIGFVNPPLRLTSAGDAITLEALGARGVPLLRMLAPVVRAVATLTEVSVGETRVTARLKQGAAPEREEDRSRSASVFDLLRALVTHLHHPGDACLGLYGAFGYALGFRFEPVRERLPRSAEGRDLVLYLADDIVFLDAQEGRAERHAYDFTDGAATTHDLPRANVEGAPRRSRGTQLGAVTSDHLPAEFEAGVRRALEAFARGDLFEVVLSQTFRAETDVRPSDLYDALRTLNPAPYGFLMNLGRDEHLVGASPEMFVRVRGRNVETCPIAGTTARGADALEDAERLRALLNDTKEEDELTMCTDVDRNDKARICEPGSVRVIGRRQVELYSRLMHTVDHVVGTLREDRDALDAFLAHTWAVTVTGAPKPDALQFIEDHEKTARGFYSGAVGAVMFNGDLNTGLTLRTARLRAGTLEVRAGATLLHASEPEKEARECVLKASAVFDALRLATRSPATKAVSARPRAATTSARVLLVDHRDSFVHTLADYLRQTGAEVTTLRAGFDPARIRELAPDLLVLSPGPGRPEDFGCSSVLDAAAETDCAVFGVCLGLQAMVEHEGGALDQLPTPKHGSSSLIADLKGPLFEGFPPVFRAGRYHSLHARTLDGSFPETLRITAMGPRETLRHRGVDYEGCVVMGVSHATRPWHAVQFHPESITTDRGLGLRLIENALRTKRGAHERSA
ncbi:MAG: anthranilate synthase component I [Sandaracinaceae bacterium]|nr:anthranilate synthase component I [Myxococcales bacterium]MCB9658319.1 anthranilate synthase component I [Sandaracinaceae bacterium]